MRVRTSGVPCDARGMRRGGVRAGSKGMVESRDGYMPQPSEPATSSTSSPTGLHAFGGGAEGRKGGGAEGRKGGGARRVTNDDGRRGVTNDDGRRGIRNDDGRRGVTNDAGRRHERSPLLWAIGTRGMDGQRDLAQTVAVAAASSGRVPARFACACRAATPGRLLRRRRTPTRHPPRRRSAGVTLPRGRPPETDRKEGASASKEVLRSWWSGTTHK